MSKRRGVILGFCCLAMSVGLLVLAGCDEVPPLPFDEEGYEDSSACGTQGWLTWYTGELALQYQPFYMEGAYPSYGMLDLYALTPAVMLMTVNYSTTSWVGTGFAGEVYIYPDQVDLGLYFRTWGWDQVLPDIAATTYEGYAAASATLESGTALNEYLWVHYLGSYVIGFYTHYYVNPDEDPNGEGELPAEHQLAEDYAAFRCSFTVQYGEE